MLKLNDLKGDWKNGINQVLNCDCMELMKMMPDKCVDLVLTDPPYGVLKDFQWDNKQYFIDNINKWIDECLRIVRGGVLLFCAEKYLPLIIDKKEYQRLLIWNKKCGCGSINNGIWYSTEIISVFIKDKEIEKKGEKDFCLSIFDQTKTENNFKYEHPTIKPIQLMSWLLKHYSNEKDFIFDPFMGSWTTARACKDLGRNFIGCEISEKYCEIGELRLKQGVLL